MRVLNVIRGHSDRQTWRNRRRRWVFPGTKTGTIVPGWFGRHAFHWPATVAPTPGCGFHSWAENPYAAPGRTGVENWTRVGYTAGVTGRQIPQLNQRKFRILIVR